MKRKITFLIAAMLLLTIITLPKISVGQTYTKVSSIAANDVIVLVTENGTTKKEMSSISSYGVALDYTTTPAGTMTLTVETGNTTGSFSFKTSSNQYVSWSSGNSLALSDTKNNASSWTVTFSNTEATIKNVGTTDRQILYNVSSPRFAAYSGKTVGDSYYITQIYKQQASTPNITVSSTSVSDISSIVGTDLVPNVASDPATFTVSGSNLKANITLSLSSTTDFEMSKNGSTYQTNDLTLDKDGTSVAQTTIYVRLKAGATTTGDKSATIHVTSTDATTRDVSLSGTISYAHVNYVGNGNTGGTAPTDAANYTYNQSVTAKNNTFVKTGYDFTHWDTKADDSGTDIDEGASFNITSSTTLYAQWSLSSYAYTLTKTGETTHATAQLKNGNTVIGVSDEIPYNTEVTIDVTTDSGYSYTVSVKDAGNNDVTVTNNKFNMPASTVAVTINIIVNPYLLATLTGTNMVNMSNAGTSYKTSKSITINGLTWTTTGFQNPNPIYPMIQLKNDAGVYLKLPTFDGKIKEIALTVTDASPSSFSEGSNKTSNTLTFNTSASYSNPVATGGGSSTNHITIDLSTKFYTTGYILASGATRIWEVTVTYMPYDNFTDWNPETPLPASLSAGANVAIASDMSTASLTIPATAALVVKSDATLTATSLINNGTASNLVIEDGGQLITTSAVAAIVKKNISAATAKSPTNWYGISSSVHKSGQTYEEMGSVTNLLGGTYDMFYYNEAESKWMNQKATVSPYSAAYTNMESCKGYIYRNAANVVLSYAGVTNAGEISEYELSYTDLTNDALEGINLIGNPYPHKIYKGVAFAVTADTLETGYYTIGGDGACTSTLNTVAIDVNQAVLVKAKSGTNGKKLTFKDRTKAPAAKSNNDNIKFIVSNSQYEDVAYALFDKCAGLDKINHRNADIPMLYINQDNEDYAIATMGDETKSFNLNFKAMTMGQYTLSYKADGNFSYLHVIDRLTGEDVDMLMEGEYSFIASPSDAENRFIVRLEYSNGYENSEDSIFAYQSGSDIIVNGEGELQIFDVMGRRVATQYVSGVETIDLQLHGVYIFKLNEKTQKIVVR